MRLSLVPPVHRATHRIGLLLQGTRPALGLSQGEAHLLAELHESGPCTVGDLHRAFAHRKSTLTGILDRMEEGGLVRRRLREEDRRSFSVELTPKGRAAAARAHQRFAELEAAVKRSVSAADLRGFAAVVDALAREADVSKEDRP
jgi:DNA-binding MarR family transcriptional regulator